MAEKEEVRDTSNDIGKNGADPYKSDADWLTNGGYDAAVEKDIKAAEKADKAKEG